jgi:dipeptidyl aminopeptidase/acylaminoacyl peptidase
MTHTEPTAIDPRVSSAIAHWAPRFVANGVLLADFQEVTAGIKRWEDWCAAWCARAGIHEQLGHEALADGWKLTGGEHLARAAVYYHFAKFVFVIDSDQMRAAHRKAVECKRLALPYLRPPGERVAIPFGQTSLVGVLRRPVGEVPPPVVVMISGLDSTKEEMDAYEAPFHARGMATLSFDGPGQGEAEYELAIRGDFEAPVKAVIDWLQTRADVDHQRIGVWGVSLGGYYAPRAAAYETRIKACISISGAYDWAEIWDQLPVLTREAFRFRSHKATESEAREHGRSLTLKDAARRIACPLFVVGAKLDRLIPYRHAERIAADARGPVELLVVEDGGHNANNRPYRYRSRSADWMAGQLGLPRR